MTRTRDMDAILDTRQLRRMRAEGRYLDLREKQEAAAERYIGELCREGKTVYYINLQDRAGRYTGKTKEASWTALVDYLVRNDYVRVH